MKCIFSRSQGLVSMGILIFCLLTLIQTAIAGCPPNSAPYSDDGQTVHCRCVKGYINAGGICKKESTEIYISLPDNAVSISQLQKMSVPQGIPSDVAELPISLPAHLWISARPYPNNERVRELRQKAAAEAAALKALSIQVEANLSVLFLCLYMAAPIEPPFDAEDVYRELEDHSKKYIDIVAELEALTGEKAAAELRRNERLKHFNDIIRNKIIKTDQFDVQVNNSTVVNRYYPSDVPEIKTPSSPILQAIKGGPQKNTHTEYSYDAYRVKVKALDKEGKPYDKWVWDIFRTSKEVLNK